MKLMLIIIFSSTLLLSYQSITSQSGKYKNKYEPSRKGFDGGFKWKLGLGKKETPAYLTNDTTAYIPQTVQPDFNKIYNPDSEKIQITWIGHSTFLIQVNGINILTDPVFSNRCSPVSFAGPKRLVPPGISFEKLPVIHTVLISHNHYDHLDLSTVRQLGNKPKYFIPLGLSEWFKNENITNLSEANWGQSLPFDIENTIRFQCVPAHHYSSRTPFDFNETLWCGWLIETRAGKIFFTGDTGYSPIYKEIADSLGPFRISLIPIGSYQPRWFMKTSHINPPEAVKIHQDIRSEQSIAMHWGTFQMSDEPLAEPPLYLKDALKKSGIDENKFIVMKIGEIKTF